MYDSKLVRLLQTLNAKEWEILQDLLGSAVFPVSPEGKQLFTICQNHLIEEQRTLPEKREIGLQIYANETTAKKKMPYLMSELTNLVERFFTMQVLLNDKDIQNKTLGSAFANRGLTEEYRKHTQKLKDKKESESPRRIRHHLSMQQLHEQLYYDLGLAKNKNNEDNLQAAMYYLDAYFLLNKLRYSCELINRKRTIAEEVDIPLLREAQFLSQHSFIRNFPLTRVYSDLLNLLIHDFDLEKFRALKRYFIQLMPQIERNLREEILMILNNVISRNLHAEPTLCEDSLFLYQAGLDAKIWSKAHRMTKMTFSNIAVLACHLKQYEWAKNFIRQYQKILEEELKESAVNYANAYLQFHQEQFEAAFDILKDLEFPVHYHTLRLRSLKVRIIYELTTSDKTYLESLLDDIEAFYRYLRHPHSFIVEDRRKPYFKFLHAIKLMASRKKLERCTMKQLEEIQHSIDRKGVAHKEWLSQKVKELEGQFFSSSI